MSKIIRQNYSPEFKAKAVKLVLEHGQSVSVISRRFRL